MADPAVRRRTGLVQARHGPRWNLVCEFATGCLRRSGRWAALPRCRSSAPRRESAETGNRAARRPTGLERAAYTIVGRNRSRAWGRERQQPSFGSRRPQSPPVLISKVGM